MSPEAIQKRKTRLQNHLANDELCVTYERQAAKRNQYEEFFEDRRKRID